MEKWLKIISRNSTFHSIPPNSLYKTKNCPNIFHFSFHRKQHQTLTTYFLIIVPRTNLSLSLSIRNELPNISVQRWPHHTEKHIPSIFPTYLHYGSDWNNRGDKIERDWAQYQFPAWWPSLNIQNVASFGGENIYRSRNCLEILALLQYWLQRVSACFREEFRIALIFKTNA